MLLLIFLLGLGTGYSLHQVAFYLPQIVGKVSSQAAYPANFAIWSLIRGKRSAYAGSEFWLALFVEILSAVVFCYFWTNFANEESLVYMGAYCFFGLIALIDLRYRLILNIMTYPAMLIVLGLSLVRQEPSLLSTLLGAFMVFGIFYLTAWLRPQQLGAGDIKLATLLGFIFGFPNVLWGLLLGAGLGGVVAIGMLLSGRYGLKTRIPYAPFLCFGALLALVYQPFFV